MSACEHTCIRIILCIVCVPANYLNAILVKVICTVDAVDIEYYLSVLYNVSELICTVLITVESKSAVYNFASVFINKECLTLVLIFDKSVCYLVTVFIQEIIISVDKMPACENCTVLILVSSVLCKEEIFKLKVFLINYTVIVCIHEVLLK